MTEDEKEIFIIRSYDQLRYYCCREEKRLQLLMYGQLIRLVDSEDERGSLIQYIYHGLRFRSNYESDPERIKKYSRDAYWRDADNINERRRKYRKDNPDKVRARDKKYLDKDREFHLFRNYMDRALNPKTSETKIKSEYKRKYGDKAELAMALRDLRKEIRNVKNKNN